MLSLIFKFGNVIRCINHNIFIMTKISVGSKSKCQINYENDFTILTVLTPGFNFNNIKNLEARLKHCENELYKNR